MSSSCVFVDVFLVFFSSFSFLSYLLFLLSTFPAPRLSLFSFLSLFYSLSSLFSTYIYHWFLCFPLLIFICFSCFPWLHSSSSSSLADPEALLATPTRPACEEVKKECGFLTSPSPRDTQGKPSLHPHLESFQSLCQALWKWKRVCFYNPSGLFLGLLRIFLKGTEKYSGCR